MILELLKDPVESIGVEFWLLGFQVLWKMQAIFWISFHFDNGLRGVLCHAKTRILWFWLTWLLRHFQCILSNFDLALFMIDIGILVVVLRLEYLEWRWQKIKLFVCLFSAIILLNVGRLFYLLLNKFLQITKIKLGRLLIMFNQHTTKVIAKWLNQLAWVRWIMILKMYLCRLMSWWWHVPIWQRWVRMTRIMIW